jgi:hypothetical protein
LAVKGQEETLAQQAQRAQLVKPEPQDFEAHKVIPDFKAQLAKQDLLVQEAHKDFKATLVTLATPAQLVEQVQQAQGVKPVKPAQLDKQDLVVIKAQLAQEVQPAQRVHKETLALSDEQEPLVKPAQPVPQVLQVPLVLTASWVELVPLVKRVSSETPV